MSDAPIPLGPFELEARAGAGGMGEVWQGRHASLGVPVAVKVLTAERARDIDYRRFFRNEVRMVAALDHAHVVQVFEHGEIGPETEKASGGQLLAGSPFLVMEWAAAGTLSSAPPPSSWDEIRQILLVLLDALAHAHARKVIHRDLKPANVLLCSPGSEDLKLADFGIARPREEDEARGARAAGTISYMSPEQALGRWRDEGPWTDLYSLGCIAYELITGNPPFSGERSEDVVRAHVNATPPPLRAPFPVPAGLAAWARALLEKEPRRRLRCAADAAWGLLQLGEPEAGSIAPRRPRQSEPEGTLTILGGLDTRAAARAVPPSTPPDATTRVVSAPVLEPAPAGVVHSAEYSAPPMPEHWTRPAPRTSVAARLRGVGLGLYGLRPIPLVDRNSELDRLWQALHDVRETGQARAVLLSGTGGTGKSRLAEWLCERATEIGAATALEARHDPTEAPGGGFVSMLARELHAGGLSRRDLAHRVEIALRAQGVDDPAEWNALAELIDEQREPGRSGRGEHLMRLSTPVERYELICRHLRRLSVERPLLIWLDDVQWGAEALRTVLYGLRRGLPADNPVLFVLTMQDEALADRPIEHELIGDLVALPSVVQVPIGPLPPDERSLLVRGLLGLEGELAAQVEERTAGNPLFAVQLVGDWVQRGLLDPTEEGFALRDPRAVALPETLTDVWSIRLDQVLAGRSTKEIAALELAAVLGHSVTGSEWSDACRRAGWTPPWGLVEALLERRLAKASEDGPQEEWSFVHAMLRETVLMRARDGGRWAAHHAVCAQMLSARGTGHAERLARHLVESGDRLGALAPLLEAALQRRERGYFRQARSLAAERERLVEALGLPESDARWGEGWVEAGRIAYYLGDDDARGYAERAERAARQHGWTRVLAEALVLRMMFGVTFGTFEDAQRASEEAQTLFRACGAEEEIPRVVSWEGILALERGEVDVAREKLASVLALFDEQDDGPNAALALYELSIANRRAGDLVRADELASEARRRALDLGMRNLAANAEMSRGENARERGDLELAERSYRDALSVYEAIGSQNAAIARLNIGLTLLRLARYDAARTELENGYEALVRTGWTPLAGCAQIELMVCSAAADDWSGWDAHWAEATALLEDTPLVDPDLAWAAGHAGRMAADREQHGRARRSLQFALDQWRALGRTDEVHALEQSLVDLDERDRG